MFVSNYFVFRQTDNCKFQTEIFGEGSNYWTHAHNVLLLSIQVYEATKNGIFAMFLCWGSSDKLIDNYSWGDNEPSHVTP